MAIIALLLLLLMAAGAWAFMSRTDPGLARVEALRAQIENAPDDQRRELYGQMRTEYESLWPETQEQLREERRNRWEAEGQRRMNEFFDLPPKEQLVKLDESIDREERWRTQREQQSAQRASSGGGGGSGRSEGRGDRGRSRGDRDSVESRKRMLDRTTPQSRAQWSEYRRMRDGRRQARGLPPSGRWN